MGEEIGSKILLTFLTNTLEVPISMRMDALKKKKKMAHLPNARDVSLSG